MGKHKIVKSAAAVALTASVVATAVAPGASAASYKTNSKDQLVYTKSGKLVKGWKVFGGKLYKNGKLAPAKKYKIIGTGAAQQLFYGPTLKKGYKTANSKTLLFKDGKLADGWKQAGKGERLYKNGKLDKGYTVYTNVEGDKFLYHNGYLKKGLKTATRGGETNLFKDGKLAKGLVQFPAENGKYYYNGKVANGEIEGLVYENGVLVTDVASVKSINATTVEVTFKKEIKADDVKAADFAIEGLTVSNAVKKQSDSKTVILTTSAQEAGKEYKLVYKGQNTAKKFTGISSVVPKAISQVKIKPYQTSQQSKVGQNVTVKAQVEVEEGQPKAGIPVTFNVDALNDKATGTTTNFNEDKTVEVYTDENGVATYSYTQYHAGEDTIYAYPTGEPTKRADVTKVYWDLSQPLTVTPETSDATLANDAKQVYKVQVSPEYLAAAKAGKLKVTFAENYEVTPDKVNYAAKVAGGKAALTQDFVTPYQTSIGGEQGLALSVNDKGEASFTVTGSNTSVTPVVYIDGAVNSTVVTGMNSRLETAELQATATPVKFDNIKTVGLTNQAQGVKEASRSKFTISELNASAKYDENFGGRQYVATLKDQDGKIAPAGTKVLLTFTDGSKNPTEYTVFNTNAVSKDFSKAKEVKSNVYELTTDKNGQVVYTVVAAKQANDNNNANGGTNYGYATPVVYLDNNNNKPNGVYDDQDTHAIGEIAYFGDAVVTKAVLQFLDANNEVIVGNPKINQPVTIQYQTVDQNGFAYTPAKDATAIFQLDTTFGNLKGLQVVNAQGQVIDVITGNTNNGITVKLNTEGQAFLEFTSTNESTVNVSATSSEAEIATIKGSIQFVTGKVDEKNAIAAINLLNGNATVDTYKNAGITGVTAANVNAVKDSVATAKATKGTDLTKEEIQAAVNNAIGDDQPVAPTATAKAYTDAVAAIPTLEADKSNKAEVEAAIAKAEEAAKALTAADKATTAVKDADTKLATAKESVKGEEAVGNTVAELPAEAVSLSTDTLLNTVALYINTDKLGELATGKTKFFIEIKGEKIELTASKFEPKKFSAKLDSAKYTEADVKAATFITE